MKTLFCCFIFLVILSKSLSGQPLDKKEEELEHLKEEIFKQEAIIQEKEKKSLEIQKNLKETIKKKQETELNIERLKASELKVKERLDQTITQLEGTNVKLADLTKLCELEFNYLFACHYESILSPDNSVNNHLLGSLILNTAGKIYNSKGKMQELELDKNRSNREYEDYIWSRIVAKKKSNKFLGLIYELEDNITKYTSEKEAALERMKELEKEAEALDELIARLRSEITLDDYTYKFSTPKLIWPVHGEVIRDFGLFTSDEYKVSLVNDGIDICVDEGTPVVTVDDGVVAFAEWYSGAGKLVIIDHQNGFYSLYSHISSILVSKGDKVKREQQIALSGKTGSVDVPCLHFELRKRGTAVNPMEYLENANIQ